MAACLVNITGTSGNVLIEYIDSGAVARSVTSGINGSLFINDNGSSYTFTKLSGDATVSSGCITFTEILQKCYILDWEILKLAKLKYIGQKFTNIIIGNTSLAITPNVVFPIDVTFKIATVINDLSSTLVRCTAFKQVNSNTKIEYFIILKVKGNDIPYLKINSETDNHSLYLKGVLTANCLPTDYTPISTCEVVSL